MTPRQCFVCHKTEKDADTKLQHCSRCKSRSYRGPACQSSDWATHKEECKRQNYVLEVHLEPTNITGPSIFRTLSCPATSTFERFHQAIQLAFGWASTHTYDFKVKDPNVEEEEDVDDDQAIANMIRSLTPGADRSGFPRKNLFRIIEKDPYGGKGVFSGQGLDFIHNGSRQHPRTPEKASSMIRLHDVLDNHQYKGMPLEYEYDFGDCWCHAITLVGRRDPTKGFVCIDGEGHGCAEDVGSTPGWQRLKAAYRASNPTKEQVDSMRWYEKRASNRESQGLGGGRDRIWSKDTINARLATM